MNIKEFSENISKAYEGRNRDRVEAAAMLNLEAAELAEIYLKARWYGRVFTAAAVRSEAGDILNFLTYILQSQGLTLEDAMEDNIKKLKNRGWLNEDSTPTANKT